MHSVILYTCDKEHCTERVVILQDVCNVYWFLLCFNDLTNLWQCTDTWTFLIPYATGMNHRWIYNSTRALCIQTGIQTPLLLHGSSVVSLENANVRSVSTCCTLHREERKVLISLQWPIKSGSHVKMWR